MWERYQVSVQEVLCVCYESCQEELKWKELKLKGVRNVMDVNRSMSEFQVYLDSKDESLVYAEVQAKPKRMSGTCLM